MREQIILLSCPGVLCCYAEDRRHTNECHKIRGYVHDDGPKYSQYEWRGAAMNRPSLPRSGCILEPERDAFAEFFRRLYAGDRAPFEFADVTLRDTQDRGGGFLALS